MVRALLVIILVTMLSSCFDQGECLITNTNIARVNLRAKKDGAVVTVLFDSVYVLRDSLLYDTLLFDTLLYARKALSALSLPVNPGVTEMTYVFNQGEKSDTLSLGYSNLTVVLAPNCGAFPYQRNLEVTYSTFGQDSVAVVNQSLLRNVAENVRIYF